MIIAVPYEKGSIFQHFGRTEQFKLYTVTDGKIVSAELVDTLDTGHGALAGFLQDRHADVLICGGIGAGAQQAVGSAGIQLYGGVQGGADEAVRALLDGTLQFDAHVQCSHHEHHDGHDCGHDCGHHA